MRNNVYGTYDEKYVKSVIVYAIDGVLYYDAEGKEAVEKKAVSDLFLKGVRVNVDGSVYDPISCTANDGDEYATLSVRKADCISIYGSKDAPAFEDVTFGGVEDITELTVGYVFKQDTVMYFPKYDNYLDNLAASVVEFSDGTKIHVNPGEYDLEGDGSLMYLPNPVFVTYHGDDDLVYSSGSAYIRSQTPSDSWFVLPAGTSVVSVDLTGLNEGYIAFAKATPCVAKDVTELSVGDVVGNGCVIYFPKAGSRSADSNPTGDPLLKFSDGTELTTEPRPMGPDTPDMDYGIWLEKNGKEIEKVLGYGSWISSIPKTAAESAFFILPAGTTVVENNCVEGGIVAGEVMISRVVTQ